jgi:hypothetical protein
VCDSEKSSLLFNNISSSSGKNDNVSINNPTPSIFSGSFIFIKINPNASIFAGNSNYVRMQFRNGIFRVYAISLGSNITPQDLAYNYGINKNLLGNHGYKWNETNDVKFFNLGEITNKYAIGHSAPCPDINGNVYNVRRRTIKCIKQLVNQKGSPAQLAIGSPSTVLRTTDASMNNTTSYVIS